MAGNYIGSKSPITVVAPAALIPGQAFLLGATLFCVAGAAAASGDAVAVDVEGQFILPKVTTDVIAAGAKVYWDDTAKLVTGTAASNKLIGVAVAALANPTTEGLFLITGQVS